MGFASGSISFRRFFITGPGPADVTDAFVETLNDHAFGRYGSASPDGIEVGWITTRHLFDTQIAAEHIAVGRFVHLAMRLDRNTPPAAVLKSYIRIEEETALEASGRTFLNKTERTQARETARLRAEREAKSGAFRRITAYPLLMDLDRQVVYFGNVGSTANDKFIQLFQDTFGCGLEPATAERSAYRLLGHAGGGEALEHVRPFHLADDPQGGSADGDFDNGDLGFLGKEFLTWLWFKTDTGEALPRPADGEAVAAMIDRVLRLECDFGMNGTSVIHAEGPGSLPEAKAALATGKQPTKLGLILGHRGDDFAFTLEGPGLAVTGMVLPPREVDAQAGAAAGLEQRCELLIDAVDLLDALYELFLRRRTAADWGRELGTMHVWAAGGSQKTSSQLASA